MKFSATEDVDAPREKVFEMLSDFNRFEDALRRRGVKVARRDTLSAPGAGMTWDGAFNFKGIRRDVTAVMHTYDRPGELTISGKSPGFEAFFEIDLEAMSPQRTRMRLGLEIKPLTVSARVLLQSMKLAKGTLDRTFKQKVANYVGVMESRARGTA